MTYPGINRVELNIHSRGQVAVKNYISSTGTVGERTEK